MQQLDFYYEISDERLLAYHRVPLLDRLKWLDEIRRFTLVARAAPDVAERPDRDEAMHPSDETPA